MTRFGLWLATLVLLWSCGGETTGNGGTAGNVGGASGAGGAAGSGGVGPETPATVLLTSDDSIVFTEPGQTARATAVVVDDVGTPLPDAEVLWRSSDPSAIDVDESGNVVAVTELGSALLTAEYGDAFANVTAVVAVLQPETRPIESDDIRSVDEDRTRIVLARTPSTESLTAGNVVVNGGPQAFLARVLAVELETDRVVVGTEDATLLDAVRDLDLDLSGATTSFEETYEEEVVSPAQKAALPSIECEQMGRTVTLGLDGLTYTETFQVRQEVNLQIRNGVVEHLELGYAGDVGMAVGLKAVKLTAGLKNKVECKGEGGERALAAIPIAYGFGIGATVTPAVGVELEAQYTDTQLSINGLEYEHVERLRAGVAYDAATGYEPIAERRILTDGAKPTKLEQAPQQSLTFKVEPFLGFDFSVALTFLKTALESAPVIGSKVVGGYEVSLMTPTSFEEPAYTGPKWNVYLGLNADFNPLVKNLGIVRRAFSRIGLAGLAPYAGIDAKIFDWKQVLLKSPDPTIVPSSTMATAGNPTRLTIRAKPSESGLEATAWGIPTSGPGVALGSSPMNAMGQATVDWTPNANDQGIWELKALVSGELFGEVDLPYATQAQPKAARTVEVGQARAEMIPTSSDFIISEGIDALGRFTVFNRGGSPIELRTTPTEPWIRMTDGPATIEPDSEYNVFFEASCPGGVAQIDLEFRDGQGQVIADGVPELHPVSLECTSGCDSFGPGSMWAGGVSFYWTSGGSDLNGNSWNVTQSAGLSVSGIESLVPTPTAISGSAYIEDRRVGSDGRVSGCFGVGEAVNRFGNPVGFAAFIGPSTYDLSVGPVWVEAECFATPDSLPVTRLVEVGSFFIVGEPFSPLYGMGGGGPLPTDPGIPGVSRYEVGGVPPAEPMRPSATASWGLGCSSSP